MREVASQFVACRTVAFALLGIACTGGPLPATSGAGQLSLPQGGIAGPARVIDGDTIDIAGVRVRLEGIDAPENGQTCGSRDPAMGGRQWGCGAAAAAAVERLIARREVRCWSAGTDRYGRVLAQCTAGDTDLSAEMVRSGYAWAFVKYSERYVGVEAEARAAGVGVWQGEATAPWEYRAQRWASAEPVAPGGCAIKGNISGKGHIYHPPWSPWYGRVTIDTTRGERWFCTEGEALAAGWRPAKAR